MLEELWKKFGESVAEKSVTSSYGPALAFFAGGFLAISSEKKTTDWIAVINSMQTHTKVAFVLVALFVVGLSANLVEVVQGAVIRLLEGYFPRPLDPFRVRLSNLWIRKIARKQKELSQLADKRDAKSKIRKRRLDDEIARLPVLEEYVMPSLLGNLCPFGKRA